MIVVGSSQAPDKYDRPPGARLPDRLLGVRLRMDLAYDGSEFHGWARQDALRTVQGELEAALATVLRVPSVAVTCAGRTDTGVHARGQVAHVDVEPDVPEPEQLRRRLDGVLPADIRVRRVVAAADGFDARFSAVWRRYAYRIADRPEAVDPLTRGHVLAWRRPLDVGAIDEASALLLGRHDFASFCKRREGATTIRTLLDPHVGARRRGPAGRERPGRRVLPPHGALARRLPPCGRRGTASAAWAGEVLAAATRDPAVAVVPHTG